MSELSVESALKNYWERVRPLLPENNRREAERQLRLVIRQYTPQTPVDEQQTPPFEITPSEAGRVLQRSRREHRSPFDQCQEGDDHTVGC